MKTSSHIKQLTLLTNYSLIGSAASYFLTIYLANILGSEKFGQYSYILVISSFSIILINWSADQTAPSYFSEGFTKEKLFNLVFFIRAIISIIVSVVLFFWKDVNLFVFFSAITLNITVFNLSYLFEINGKNSTYSFIYMLERLIYVLLVVIAIKLGYTDLRFIFFLYFIVVFISLFVQYFIFENKFLKYFKIPKFSDVLFFLKRNFTIVIISFSSFVYGGISRLFIGEKLGLHALGLFSSAMQITVLASIFQAQVERIWRLPLYTAFAEKNKDEIFKNIKSFMKLSTLPSLFGAISLLFLSEFLVDLVFSKDYWPLKKILPLVAIFFVTINLNSLISICWVGINKSSEYLILSVFSSLIMLSIFVLMPKNTSLTYYIISILFCQLLLILYSSYRIFVEVRGMNKK